MQLLSCILLLGLVLVPSADLPESLTVRNAVSRTAVRPGEWLVIALAIDPADADSSAALTIGAPDDGLRASETDTDSRLRWISGDSDDPALVPDLTSLQWPRLNAEGSISLPAVLYIPVKVLPETDRGEETIDFELVATLLGDSPQQFTTTQSVAVNVVHPTDSEATDTTNIEQELFFGWHGEMPDWSVHDARAPGPRRGAPLMAWLLVSIPPGLLILVLGWLFLTRRL